MFHAVIQQKWKPHNLSPHLHASKVPSLLTRPQQDENDVNAKYSTGKHARCGEWQLCTGRIFSHECYGSRGIIIITAWSRCGQIRGFHCLLLTLSQKQRCWELQSSCGTFWDFVSLSWQGHRVWKKCAYHLLSIIPANTAEEIYNSTTQEHIQFTGASVFLHFFIWF